MLISEMRTITIENLVVELEVARKQLFKLRMNFSLKQLENPNQLKKMRRTVARIETVLHERKKNEQRK